MILIAKTKYTIEIICLIMYFIFDFQIPSHLYQNILQYGLMVSLIIIVLLLIIIWKLVRDNQLTTSQSALVPPVLNQPNQARSHLLRAAATLASVTVTGALEEILDTIPTEWV